MSPSPEEEKGEPQPLTRNRTPPEVADSKKDTNRKDLKTNMSPEDLAETVGERKHMDDTEVNMQHPTEGDQASPEEEKKVDFGESEPAEDTPLKS